MAETLTYYDETTRYVEDDWKNVRRRPTTTQGKVRQFHETFGHPIGDDPRLLPLSRWILRADLIAEEARELDEALNVPDIVDALADLVYVAYGMALEMGVDLDAVIAEVHRANMRKLGPDGEPIYRSDGKVIKPEGWEGPDIEGELYRQGWKGN